MTLKVVKEIADRYPVQQGELIQLLLDIQSECNWIPEEAIMHLSEKLNIPISQIYSVASFYKGLSLTERGEHIIKVCLGTACHVGGGSRIAEKLEELLDIKTGETTKDMKFTLERVNCLGCCALGPVVMVDDKYHKKVSPVDVKAILDSY
ncbi:NAD(P)H-dependent oxidoreductase subunit E [Chloroflexota bacterium]